MIYARIRVFKHLQPEGPLMLKNGEPSPSLVSLAVSEHPDTGLLWKEPSRATVGFSDSLSLRGLA